MTRSANARIAASSPYLKSPANLKATLASFYEAMERQFSPFSESKRAGSEAGPSPFLLRVSLRLRSIHADDRRVRHTSGPAIGDRAQVLRRRIQTGERERDWLSRAGRRSCRR